MKKNKSKRSKFFVDREFQGAIAKRIALHWGLLICLYAIGMAMLHLTGHFGKPFEEQFQSYLNNYGGTLLFLASLTPVFVYDSIKLTNRLAGPLHRLRRGLKALARGQEGEQVTFRPNDFWRDMAEDYNRVRDRLLAAEKTLSNGKDVHDVLQSSAEATPDFAQSGSRG